MQFAFSFMNKKQASTKNLRKNRKKLHVLFDISMTISSVEHISRFLEAFHKWMKMSKEKKNDG